MKRFTLSVVITAVLALAAYSLADAHGGRRDTGGAGDGAAFQQDERGRPGAGFGRGLGRRGGGPLMSLRGVDLTDDQRAKIRALVEAERQAGAGPQAGASLRRDLHAAIFAEAPDAAKIAGLQEQVAAAQTARLARQIELEQQIAQILTPEQRAQLRERPVRARGGFRP